MAASAAAMRIAATEEIPNDELLPALRAAGMSADHAVSTMVAYTGRLRRLAGHGDSESEPLRIDRDRVTFSNLVGVMRIAPGIEVELAPKFLAHTEPDWREDFIAIASITGEGRLLTQQRVSASLAQVHDLASLIGQIFSEEFLALRRTPLRVYQRRRWRDYALDGELDVAETHAPHPDGLPQRAVLRDARNPFNALIAAAAEMLLGDVRHPVVRSQLSTVRAALGKQDQPALRLPPIPSRHRHWLPLIELAQHIIAGFEVSLRSGAQAAPGFVLRSWQAWERLLYLALRDGLGPGAVTPKRAYDWGRRGPSVIRVTPDLSVDASGTLGVLDAKYKGKAVEAQNAMSQADLMEAAAFMAGSKRDRIALLYPRTAAGGSRWPTGAARIFDRADLRGDRVAIGVEVEVRGFGAPHGRSDFTGGVTQAVTTLVTEDGAKLVPGMSL